MTCYISVEFWPDGTVKKQGLFQKVYSILSATPLDPADAQYFQSRAYEYWPEFEWTLQSVPAKKYIVKGKLDPRYG